MNDQDIHADLIARGRDMKPVRDEDPNTWRAYLARLRARRQARRAS